jgi:hypothetical protein
MDSKRSTRRSDGSIAFEDPHDMNSSNVTVSGCRGKSVPDFCAKIIKTSFNFWLESDLSPIAAE